MRTDSDFTFEVTAEYYAVLEAAAKLEGVTVEQFVQNAVLAFLEKHDPQRSDGNVPAQIP